MASKLPPILLLSRRSYAVAAENVNVRVQAASVMTKKKVVSSPEAASVEKEEFWMRDPNTGNWIPESHFNQIDVADLRAKFLSKPLTKSN